MWSMGVLLYEMVAGRPPFGSSSKETTCRLIINVDLAFPKDFDVDAQDLVVRLCKKSASARLDVRGAMAHFFVVKHDACVIEGSSKVQPTEDCGRPPMTKWSLRND